MLPALPEAIIQRRQQETTILRQRDINAKRRVQIKSFQNAEELTVGFGGTEGSEDLIKVTFVQGFEGFQ